MASSCLRGVWDPYFQDIGAAGELLSMVLVVGPKDIDPIEALGRGQNATDIDTYVHSEYGPTC